MMQELERETMLRWLYGPQRVVWDPANGLTTWERIGDGAVDYKGQFTALIADGYCGVVSVETHYEPAGKSPAEATRLTTEGLRAVLASL